MPRINLTDVSVRALKPDGKQTVYWDVTLPAFGCRVSQNGTKSWVIVKGRERRIVTLSRYPIVPLKEARGAAKLRLAAPVKEPISKLLFDEAKELFLKSCEGRTSERTQRDYRRHITKHFSPELGTTRLEDLTTEDFEGILDDLKDTPSEALHSFHAVRTMLRWCNRRKQLSHNPLDSVEAPARIKIRERVLSNVELAKVIITARTDPTPFGPIILLCAYLGQRRSEIGMLRWEYIDQKNKMITLPASITKNRKTHVFPYTDTVQRIFDRVESRKGYLFPGREYHKKLTNDPERSFGGWARGKYNFDRRCPLAEHWQIHDLRRTFSSTMAALGVLQVVVEKLLNHVSGGALSPIARVYNQHSYQKEMRAALELLDRHISSICLPVAA